MIVTIILLIQIANCEESLNYKIIIRILLQQLNVTTSFAFMTLHRSIYHTYYIIPYE